MMSFDCECGNGSGCTRKPSRQTKERRGPATRMSREEGPPVGLKRNRRGESDGLWDLCRYGLWATAGSGAGEAEQCSSSESGSS